MTAPLRSLAVAALLADCLAAPPLATATPVPVTGSATLAVGVLPAFDFPFQGVVDVSGGTLTVPAGLVSGSVSVPIDGYPLGLITGIVVTMANTAGQFSVGGAAALCPGPFASGRGACVSGGGFGGSMPWSGVVQVKGALGFTLPLSVVGADGEQVATLLRPPAATSMAPPGWIQGAAWTTGMANVTTTASGQMYDLAGSAAGALGAAGSTLTFVTPAHVNPFSTARSPVFSTISFTFVPEPGTIGLVVAGLAGLALIARSRDRH
jgi:hypothetical protein